MKRSTLFLLAALTAALAIPALAAEQHGRDQSYFTFEDGGTVLKQGDDGRDVDVRVNLPVYPGDDITTSHRGRTEIHLSDGNVLSLDHDTAIHVRSILDSYDGDNSQTIIELHSGHVAIQRTGTGQDIVRLDTASASYVAQEASIYAVEADTHGKDRVLVFDGTIEVRTPARTIRVRAGEEARVDDQGLYGLVSLGHGAGDDFEHWFIQRAQRYDAPGHYLDSSLAYSEADLADNGSWVYASDVSAWCWRPRVEVGWRPYYNGYWNRSRGGSLVWVSNEPWGWAPYHYGRWAFEPSFGWVWLPGSSYSPAWVYWMYGPSYVGWAPMGWYDCYRPYYGWAYRPYARARFDAGFGFSSRVRVSDIDLRPWTFVSPDHMIGSRIDHSALTTEVIRERLHRDPGAGYATIGSSPVRFTRDDLKDPAAAIGNLARRGIGGGKGGSSAVDMTPFFRRDPEIGNDVRNHIVRSRATISVPPPSSAGGGSTGHGASSGVPTPGTGGTLEGRVNRGDGSAPRGDNPMGNVPAGTLHRGDNPPGTGQSGATGLRGGSSGSSNNSSSNTGTWRDHIDKPGTSGQTTDPAAASSSSSSASSDNWRGRAVNRGGGNVGSSGEGQSGNSGSGRGSDVPRRIIDRIGGARIYGDDGSSSNGSGSSGSSNSGSGSKDSGSSGNSSASSGSSGNSGSGNSGSGSSGSSGSTGRGSSGSSGKSGNSGNSGSHSSPPPSHGSSGSSGHSSGSHDSGSKDHGKH